MAAGERQLSAALNWALAAAIGANLFLVWSSRFVPATDQVNHVASLHVLGRLVAHDPFFGRYFRIVLSPVPDLVSEILWWIVLRPFAVVTAGRLLLSIYVISLPLAYLAFLRRLNPANECFVLLAPLVTFNIHYGNGSLNFLLGLPLCLLAATALDAVPVNPRALWVFVSLAAATYLAHVYDLLCLAGFAGVASLRAGVQWRRGEQPFAAHGAARRWCIAMVTLALLLALAVRFVLAGGQHWTHAVPMHFDLSPWQATSFLYDAVWLRGASGTRWFVLGLGALFAVPAVAQWSAARGKGFRSVLCAQALGSALVFYLATYLSPSNIGDEVNIGARFAIVCVLCLFAGIRVPASKVLLACILGVLVVLFVAKWLDEQSVCARFDREATVLDARIVSALPRHATVLPVARYHQWDDHRRLFLHFWDYATIERDAFVPNLFGVEGQQVLRYKRGQQPTNSFHERLTARDLVGYEYVWISSDFADELLTLVRPRLEPVARVGIDQLFRVY